MAEPDSGGAALGRAGYVRPECARAGHAGAFRQFGVISKRGLVGRCCSTLWGLGPDGQWQNLTPEAPHWAGPTTWDPNAPQPVMQALSDNSGSYPNVDSSDGVVRTLWGLGPDGRWQNLTPEPPVVAGPATYDPNAPEPIVRTLPAQISLVGVPPEPPAEPPSLENVGPPGDSIVAAGAPLGIAKWALGGAKYPPPPGRPVDGCRFRTSRLLLPRRDRRVSVSRGRGRASSPCGVPDVPRLMISRTVTGAGGYSTGPWRSATCSW